MGSVFSKVTVVGASTVNFFGLTPAAVIVTLAVLTTILVLLVKSSVAVFVGAVAVFVGTFRLRLAVFVVTVDFFAHDAPVRMMAATTVARLSVFFNIGILLNFSQFGLNFSVIFFFFKILNEEFTIISLQGEALICNI